MTTSLHQRVIRKTALGLASGLPGLPEIRRQTDRHPPAAMADFRIRTRGGFMNLAVADVDFVTAEREYVRFHLGSASYLHRQTLSSLEHTLPPDRWVRIHRSTLVRKDRVAALHRSEPWAWQVEMVGGRRFPIGRSYRPKVGRAMAEG